MHGRAAVAEVFKLHRDEGLGRRQIAARTGISAGTVGGWLAGKVPEHSRHLLNGDSPEPLCLTCGQPEHKFSELPRAYVYLLGLYLGDGCISAHRRGVYRLRIFLDLAYPGIIDECETAMRAIVADKVHRLARGGSYESPNEFSNVQVSAYSKSLPCLFPQHGPGMKHTRRIWLWPWQQKLAERWPEALVRGLIQSDGCRFMNTSGHSETWSAPRYAFSNVSTDITSIFCTACDKAGLHWTAAFPTNERKAVTIYVSHKADVARMDEFVGPKR